MLLAWYFHSMMNIQHCRRVGLKIENAATFEENLTLSHGFQIIRFADHFIQI